jgi:hypothetical protein
MLPFQILLILNLPFYDLRQIDPVWNGFLD